LTLAFPEIDLGAINAYNTLMVSMSQTGFAKTGIIVGIVAIIALGSVGVYFGRQKPKTTPEPVAQQLDTSKLKEQTFRNGLDDYNKRHPETGVSAILQQALQKEGTGDYAGAQAALDSVKTSLTSKDTVLYYQTQVRIYGEQKQLKLARQTMVEALKHPEVSSIDTLRTYFSESIITIDSGKNPFDASNNVQPVAKQ
jgi:hypothetical protein